MHPNFPQSAIHLLSMSPHIGEPIFVRWKTRGHRGQEPHVTAQRKVCDWGRAGGLWMSRM